MDHFPFLSPNCYCATMDDQDSKVHILENPTKNIKTETGIDWISELPDALIVRILSLIPITDAYKTTLLSKRWQNLWACIDNVIFDRILEVNEFISFTVNVLCHLSCSNIKKFSLRFDFNSDAVLCVPIIDKWLEIAVNKKVEDLDLDVWFRDAKPYSLPQVLCSSSSILQLNCNNCVILEECVLNWTSLKSLTLENLYLRDEHIEQIMSSCPQLESLKLSVFCGFHRLHATSSRFKRLELIDHWHPDENWQQIEGGCWFEIVAPYVQDLKISGPFNGVGIRLGDLSSLVNADLTFSSYDCPREQDEVIDKVILINNLLGSVSCANELTVPSWLIEGISKLMLKKEDASLPLLECKWLTINSWMTEYSFHGIASLLRSTPYLENLGILHESDYRGVKLINRFFTYQEEDIIDLLGDNYLSLTKNLFKGSLQNLKNAKVISTFCDYDMTKLPELLKSLLEHAINLEKLVIATEHRSCDDCSTKISTMIRKLLAFPRSSNGAVVSSGYISTIDFHWE